MFDISERGKEKGGGIASVDGKAYFRDPAYLKTYWIPLHGHPRENAHRMPFGGKAQRVLVKNPLCASPDVGDGDFGQQQNLHTGRASTHTRCQISNAKRA